MRSLKFAAAGLLGLFAATSAGAEPVKIRLSWIVPVSNWGSLLLEKKDLAKHLGQSYTLETTRFAGTPPLITALLAVPPDSTICVPGSLAPTSML